MTWPQDLDRTKDLKPFDCRAALQANSLKQTRGCQ